MALYMIWFRDEKQEIDIGIMKHASDLAEILQKAKKLSEQYSWKIKSVGMKHTGSIIKGDKQHGKYRYSRRRT